MTQEVVADAHLLAHYVHSKSADAFAGIVHRYVDLVYATARRALGDDHLAQDVTQATFLVLMKKAHQLDARTLPGWLVNTTRLAAKEAVRAKLCRERHETRAAMNKPPTASQDEAGLEQITPM